ncbi:MAG: type II toxin-antitoxin system RelE/ParE family toxin [Sedimentisphaerales bacterium]|nr:type II toxin-antitoxin system RelE/ParE family toxin [Sedimentisphaerales bacterium]
MYHVDIREDAAKAIERLPRRMRDVIYDVIVSLANNPRPHGCKKFKFPVPLYRIRIADYRIVYTIEDKRLVVLVIRVAHRREVYRQL